MPWYSYHELQRRFDDLHLIDTPRLDGVIERLSSLQRYGFSVRQRRLLGRYYGRTIARRLAAIEPDVVISVGATHKLVDVPPRWPIVQVSDGMFLTMAEYYEKFGRFRQYVVRDAHEDHQRLLDKTSMVLFASEWARTSALHLYRITPERTRVVPFGANIDSVPPIRPREAKGPLQLLFVGYDWKRKGGDIVLAAWKELRKLSADCELHIVGCVPACIDGLDGVTAYGRLAKSLPADLALLESLYDRASMFFMPSRQEAFGMVFCEAAANGLPAIAAATGGIPSSVIDGETGHLLPIDATPAMYAEVIWSLWQDPARYAAYAKAARARFEQVLNWRAWGDSVENAIQDVISGAISFSPIEPISAT